MAGPILDRTDVSVIDGRIYEIGRGLVAADGQAEIDVGGLWVMPGIVDAHSHLAVTGINEGSQSISAEVRQADVVNHRQLGIHRALAGGVTTIHTMHGSANSIGGQNAVLKLKYETSPAEMLVETGPRIVKFALGENVTRSRTPARFPNTRMGVESVMRQAFVAAQQYQEERDLYTRAAGAGLVVELPRRDLRLEALSEILGGDIWVHSHCYRADEILRLLAVAEDFGFRIATLQHVLEGYRVLPEMVHHGVGGSTFSDWWSYKVEARQAIPYNAAMMAGAGIVTSINSDSAELIRHLNLEASKTLRFGGLDADQALRLITLNPAIQIGLDERIGSLEKGKDGDLAVFRGHPLDTHALNVMTVVEGEIYFAHKELDLDRRTTGVEESAPIDETEIPTPPRLPLEIETSPEALYAIRGATLHPVSSPPIERGTLVLREGRIEVLGGEVAPPPGAIVVEADGLHVYPGLINAASQLSLFEISGLEQTRDHAELARFQPDLRTTSAIDPFSEHVAVARAEGITTAAVLPTGGIVSGRGSLVQLDGWSMPEMLREGEIGLVVSLPSLPARLPAEDRAKAIDRLAAAWEEIERYFDRAVHFSEAQPGVLPRDLGHEAMTPYLRAEKKVLFRANSYKDILQAVRFAEHYGLRAVILGGGEAWKVAEELARKEIPVIVTTVFTRPTGPFERFDDFYANAGRLEAAGVEFCIAREGREDNLDTKLLPIQAGMAVAHGLSAERAVRAITIDAARILGVGSQIGSLEPGKVADVIVTTGDPTKATTRTVASFIAGVPMDLGSLHEENYKKWSARPVPDLDPVGELRGPPPMRGGD
jgi:imidazolonepropionase-like amidohydrolase